MVSYVDKFSNKGQSLKGYTTCTRSVVLCPDPTPKRGRGLALFEPFLGLADSTVI